jgi:site-specific DNA recombinase
VKTSAERGWSTDENCALHPCQVSTTEQAKEGYSLAHQKRRLVSFCESRDWSIVEIYSDEGISASSLTERPQALKMLEDAKRGNFENILILKVDRLCRNTRDLLEIVDLLKKYNVRLNAVDEQIDYTTPTGKMMLTMLGSFAELERSTIAERMKSGREQKVRTGIKSKTGKVLYGYKYLDGNYIIIEEQADIVRLIYNKVLNGESYRSIAKYLVENKITSTENKKWNASTVRRLVLNPTYKGYTFASLYKHPAKYIDFDTAILQKATNVEPIVSEDLYDQVIKIVSSRKGTNVRKFARSDFYFADVVYCHNCGWKLYAKNAKNANGKERRKYYRCYYNSHNFDSRCNFTSIENGVLEELFLIYLEKLDVRLDNAEDPKDDINIEEDQILLNNLKSNRDKIKQRKERLLEKLLDGLIPDEEYTSTSINLADELDELDRRIEELERVMKKGASISNTYTELRKELKQLGLSVRDLWDTLSDEQKRTFVTSLVNKIYVAKSRIVSIEFN